MTSNDFNKQLTSVRDNIMDAIRKTLGERLSTEKYIINMDYYRDDCAVTWYNFFDIDGNGYGVALKISSIEKCDDDYYFHMGDENDDAFSERELADFNACELVWILEMLEDTFEFVDDYEDGDFRMTFDDDED